MTNMAESQSELFNAQSVSLKMNNIEGYFSDFADTLDRINAFVQTNVNASLASAVYGDLGGKLINIWNQNAATFNDFHENFDNWAAVVAIITSNNKEFAVDSNATYRDNAGTQDGVQSARDFVSKSNGLANVTATEGFSSLDEDTRKIFDSAYGAKTIETTENTNKFGGRTISYTDAEGQRTTIYYDDEGIMVAKKVGDTYYNSKGVKIDSLPSAEEYKTAKEEKSAEAKQKDEEAKTAEEYLDPEGFNDYHSEFVNSIKDGAIATYEKYGVLPSLTIAQAVMESGWGRSPIGHNLFGIKAGSKWDGKVVRCGTHEQLEDGTVVQTSAVFRDYDSFEESIDDHGKLVSQGRYEKVPEATNYKEAAQAVADAGYATSHNYADSLIGLIEKYGLDQWDPKTT